MKVKAIIPILVLCIISIAGSAALEEKDVEHEFNTTGFIFEYNDHNTSTYEGDSGLILGYCNNTADNTSLIIPKERVRTLAYASNGTFKFPDGLIIKLSVKRDDGKYVLLQMRHHNGTWIPILDIENDDLTNEQKKYFDDYYQQKSDYNAKQEEFATKHLRDEYKYSNGHKSKYGYYMGSNGYGLIYNP